LPLTPVVPLCNGFIGASVNDWRIFPVYLKPTAHFPLPPPSAAIGAGVRCATRPGERTTRSLGPGATRKATENTNSPSVENVQAAVANIEQCFADLNS
jgi:hypothetical protein